MERLRQCIESLPPKNAALLDFIISLASRIAAKSEINKMNARALATCLAPALIGVKDSVCSSSVEVNIVELMITQQPNLFRVCFIFYDMLSIIFMFDGQIDAIPSTGKQFNHGSQRFAASN